MSREHRRAKWPSRPVTDIARAATSSLIAPGEIRAKWREARPRSGRHGGHPQ